MNVNGIIKQAYYDNANGAKVNNKNNGTGFYESLSENINNRNENTQNNVAPSKAAAIAAQPYAYRNVISADSYENEIAGISSITSCDARQLSYGDSDYVKVFPADGYSLTAKVDYENRNIYIERKAEDGSISGYEVALDKIADNTTNPIEQTALEAWGKVELEKNVANNDEEQNPSQSGEKSGTDEDLTWEEALSQFYDFVQDRIKNGDIKYMIGKSEFSQEEWEKFLASLDKQIDDIVEETKEHTEEMKNQYIDADKTAGLTGKQLEEQALQKWREEMDAGVPYGYLAKNGVIEYNGVTFVCDKEHKAIHLGDTSNMKNCIRVSLSKGGCLIVNRANLGDLAKAIGMFSPEDVNLIMRAIAEDAKIQQMKKQIDDVTSGEELAEEVEEEQESEDIEVI
ncbi:MAG: hypothetical protein J1D87_10295 [Lachnospiraceae bacterium]|nr:hypothetical protein [Lachnospiraceae bacterium]